MKKIALFCASSRDVPQSFNDAAAKVTAGLCSKGYGIVSGGTVLGTMGVISRNVAQCGGYHKGVLPGFMKGIEYKDMSEVIWTDTMAQRKEEMRNDTAAVIALPGGIGTLDELVETLVLKKLDQYHGRVVILNIDGFYNPLLELLNHYVATGVLPAADKDLLETFDSAEELLNSF